MIPKESMTNSTVSWKKPKEISGVLDRMMRGLGLSRQFDGWQVVANWPEIVGPAIAERAIAERYEDGTLYVSVEDDVWRQQLSMQIESILKDVYTRPYGKAVRQIRLQRGRKGNVQK